MNIYWITKVDKQMLHKTSRIECAEALRKRGHDVTLVAGGNNKKVTKTDDNFLLLPMIKFSILSIISFNLSILINLPFLAKKENVDVILIDAGNVYLPFLLPLKLMGFKLVLDIRTLPIDNKRTIHSFLFDLSMILSKYLAHGLTTITPELREVLKKKYQLQNNIIGVWTSGVSLKRFNPQSTTTNKNIENIFQNPNNFYVFYHGAYSPTRGLEQLIGGYGEIEKSLQEKIKLIIIGFDEKKRKDIHKLCKKLNIEENVFLLPPVDYQEIPTYIQKCDVGVIPLPPENKWWKVSAPLKTLEYLAMSKPIIATNIPFHREIFEKGNCGILIENSEAESIANAISNLYNNREKLDLMGKKGREIVEKYYSWEKSASDLEVFIKKIVLRK